MSANTSHSMATVAAQLATALTDLLDRGHTDDEGRFVIVPSQEELDDAENGIVEIAEAQRALRAFEALQAAPRTANAPTALFDQSFKATRRAYTWYVETGGRTVCAVHADGIGLDAAESVARRLAASYNACRDIPIGDLEGARFAWADHPDAAVYELRPEGEDDER